MQLGDDPLSGIGLVEIARCEMIVRESRHRAIRALSVLVMVGTGECSQHREEGEG